MCTSYTWKITRKISNKHLSLTPKTTKKRIIKKFTSSKEILNIGAKINEIENNKIIARIDKIKFGLLGR